MKTKEKADGYVNYDNAKKTLSSQTDNGSLENVLILQGGDSLGAFGFQPVQIALYESWH
jgi:hypothetical protein